MKRSRSSDTEPEGTDTAAITAQLRDRWHRKQPQNSRCGKIGDRSGMTTGRGLRRRIQRPLGARRTPEDVRRVTNGRRECRMPTPVRSTPSRLQAGHTGARAHRWPSGLLRWRCCSATTCASRFAPASPSPWHSTWNRKLRQKQASPSGCAESGIAAAAGRSSAIEATFAPTASRIPTPVGSARPARRTVGSPKGSIAKTNPFGEWSRKATPVDKAKAVGGELREYK